jgi:TolB-like protein/tetratricopeptide (TPR) repeat protein
MKRPVTPRRSLFSEIRSRGVIHIAGLYVVGAWVIVQVADIVSQGPMPMPPEAIRLIWAALFLGFPIALLFGWRYDITREGIRRTDTRDGVAEEPLGRTDYGIIGGLSVLAIAIAGFTAAGVLDAIRNAEIETEVTFANSPPAINSIAVLPFDSCEQSPDVEILGSALAAQLIEWLAAGEGLKVIARASSFSFRSSTFGFRQISGSLNVAHLLTGTLCRENGSLRLDVQLVDPEGFVVVSETFHQPDDPTLPQSDTLVATVAQWTTGQLGLTGPAVMVRACENLDAYQQTLVGREYLKNGEFVKALNTFERAVEKEPGCADAVAGVVRAKISSIGWEPVDHHVTLQEQEEPARRAVAMDPTSAFAAETLAELLTQQDRNEEAEQVLRNAISYQPRSASLHARLAGVVANRGDPEEAQMIAKKAIILDPTSTVARGSLSASLARQNRMSEGIRVLMDGIELDPLNTELLDRLAWAYYGVGQFHNADRTFDRMRTLPDFPPDAWRDQFLITLWSGRIDKAIALAINMLENGGEDLAVDFVHRELCYASMQLGILGLHDAMNQWMEQLGRVPGDRFQNTWKEFNGYRLLLLDEYDAAAAFARRWFEDIGGMDALDSPVLESILFTLASAGEYREALDIIEASGKTDFYGDGPGGSIRATALYGLGIEPEASEAIEQAFVSQIPEQEERLFADGWRPPRDFYELAYNYALAGRREDALDALEMAVDAHYRWPLREPWEIFDAVLSLYEEPRFLELEEIVLDDLDRQARRIEAMLAKRDTDVLFAGMLSQFRSDGGP